MKNMETDPRLTELIKLWPLLTPQQRKVIEEIAWAIRYRYHFLYSGITLFCITILMFHIHYPYMGLVTATILLSLITYYYRLRWFHKGL